MQANHQANLDEIYIHYMNHILSFQNTERALENCLISSPQFIDISVERGKYIESKFKTLFVGQETFGWVSNNEQKAKCGLNSPNKNIISYINTLKGVYKEFNLGIEYYNTPIYQFISSVVTASDDVGFLMNNCLRHDGLPTKNRVPYDVEEIITFENNYVFRKEVEILNPDCIVFLTGPSYDNVIRNSYTDVEFMPFKSYHTNEFSILKHKCLPEKTYRIYHPNYHNRKGREYKKRISSEIIELIF